MEVRSPVAGWSAGRLADTGVFASFDLSLDGRRIFALSHAASADDQQTESHVTLVFNSPDEVRRRVCGC